MVSAVNLKKILLKAHSKTAAIGSSTACVVSLKGDRLCYANVGDSGSLVFRGKRLFTEQGDIVVAGSDGVFDNLLCSGFRENMTLPLCNCCLSLKEGSEHVGCENRMTLLVIVAVIELEQAKS
ncbi:hypothetical protein POTOM_061875 [Populus tomentosa]|uniref:Protein phosphatase n=1 Tax=Populus tomentosa TaxID=118781 RepID=A0A8X8BZX8_POPTO|nr:hypothetical protein POTOM_061875 [Populus tomentosa]